ncbi:MAG: flagellin [Oleiphilaceae bacterium]|jgi:flagellin
MPQIINSNIASLTAQRNLNSAQSDNAQALNRLSSGLRINSAKDDAAGIAISTRFDSQIQGLNVATRNAGDGVSLAQTAEGGLDSMTTSLQRLRELAVQSSNATNSDVDRAALNEEAQQLISEIDRVSQETNFNGVKLLNGDFTDATFQVGANAGETIDVSVNKVTIDTLGVGDGSGLSSSGTTAALELGDLRINNIDVNAATSGDDTASTDLAGQSSIATAAAINKVSDETGVTAVVDKNIVSGAAMATGGAQADVLTLNDVDINLSVGGTDLAADRAAVVTAINAESDRTGIVAVDSGSDTEGVSLQSADGRNIEVAALANNASFGLAANATNSGGYTLISDSGGDIKIGGDNVESAGLIAGTFDAGQATTSSTNGGGGTGAVVTDGAAADYVSGALAAATGELTIAVTSEGESITSTLDLSAFGGGNSTVTAAAINTAIAADTALNGKVEAFVSIDGALPGVESLSLRTTSSGADTALTLSGTAIAGAALNLAAAGATGSGESSDKLDAGDLVINNVQIGAANAASDTASDDGPLSSSKEASGIAKAAAINASSSETGVTATVNATTVDGGTQVEAAPGDIGAQGDVYINGVQADTLTLTGDADTDKANAIGAINSISGQTGVIASDTGEGIQLTAADGRNISVAIDTKAFDNNAATAAAAFTGSDVGLAATVDGIGESDFVGDGASIVGTYAGTAETTYSDLTLSAAGKFDIAAGSNGSVALEGLGFEAGTFGGTTDGQFLKDVDISTVDGANSALAAVDNALQQINTERAALGAIQNRFEATITSNTLNSENLSAANSRIRDADFAAETAALSRSQVLQQAGISILSQANALPQQALSLLG